MKIYISIISIGLFMLTTGCHRTFVTEKPADVVIDRPKPPGPNFVWIGPGYVKKNGKQVYRPGYWTTPRNPNHRWIDGRWKAKPKRGGWVWIPGHWN